MQRNGKGTLTLLRNVFRNLGDEAMLAAEIALLRNRFPDVGLHVLTDDPAGVSARYGVAASFSDAALLNPFPSRLGAAAESIASRRPRGASFARGIRDRVLVPLQCRLLLARAAAARGKGVPTGAVGGLVEVLRNTRLLVSGGGLIPSVRHTEAVRRATLRAASLLQVPYVLHGQTIYRSSGAYGPYSDASAILLRDPAESRRNAMLCGIGPERLIDSHDPVFCAPLPDSRLADSLLADSNPAGEPFAVVSLRPGFPAAALAEIAGQLRALAGQGHFSRFLLCGLQCHPAASDLPVLEYVQRLLGPSSVVLPPFYERPELLPALLSRARFVLAARYHAALYSLAVGTPTVGLAVNAEYTLKLSGAFQAFRREEFLLETPGEVAARGSAALCSNDRAHLLAEAYAMSRAADTLSAVIERFLA